MKQGSELQFNVQKYGVLLDQVDRKWERHFTTSKYYFFEGYYYHEFWCNGLCLSFECLI